MSAQSLLLLLLRLDVVVERGLHEPLEITSAAVQVQWFTSLGVQELVAEAMSIRAMSSSSSWATC